jgi:Tol biopolymer transport system component
MAKRERRPILLAAVLAAALLPAAASASFPGGNARLVVVVSGCEEGRHLVSTPWRGGPLTPVTPQCEMGDPGAVETFHPDAAPDGRSLIAVQRHGDAGFVTMAADGSGRKVVQLPEGFGGWQPSFAPDGERFAFSGDFAIGVARVDGSGAHWLTDPCPEGNCVGYTDPHWSPDGKLLAVNVEHYGTVPKPKPPARGMWLMRASDGKLVRRIAKPHARDVDWAPNGRSLVYTTSWGRGDDDEAVGGNLYRVGRDGRNVRRLVHRERIAETSPSWSPDGRWISWVSIRFDGGGDVSFDVIASVWRKRVSGGRPKRVVRLPSPPVDEAFFDAPHLTWLPR